MPIHDAAARGYRQAPEVYERGRPDYPAEAVEFLAEKLALRPGKIVLDLGAGTGKLTRVLLPTGAEVMAVEPVEAMRQILRQQLPHVQALEGTAEQLPLPDASVDAVVVGQAFHWFDGPCALAEIHRVLRPGAGGLGLLWNVLDDSEHWVAELLRIFGPFEADAPRYVQGRWRAAFESTSHFGPLESITFRQVQRGPLQRVLDRVASISYIASLPEGTRAAVLEDVERLIRSHPSTASRALLELPYRTDVYVSAHRA